MCGRYSLSTTAELVDEVFGVDVPEDFVPRWNIAPSEPAPIVRPSPEGGRRLDLLRWGFPPATPPAGSRSSGGPLRINARGETAATLPAFRDSFRQRRCLVPADGFYEWATDRSGRRAHHVRFRDRRLFALAGLWDERREGGAPTVESFTILTCPPAELVRPLHDRMPVILPPDTWEEWLRSDQAERLVALLAPWEGPGLEVVPVGPYVNRAGNEGPECLGPPPPPMPPAQRSLFR
jgi:putative SOS response-associated peptidase YedK